MDSDPPVFRISRFGGASALLGRAQPFLAAKEPEHNLLFGILAFLQNNPGKEALLLAAESAKGVGMVALQTPPQNLVLSCAEAPGALSALVTHLAADFGAPGAALPGVLGRKEETARFCALWQEATGQASQLIRAQRIYKLETVTPPKGVSGYVRPARGGERDKIAAWALAFAREALQEGDAAQAKAVVNSFLASGSLFVWEDGGEPVAMAAASGETPHGRRVSLVYTPPERRRRGYASACVAALSEYILKSRRFCFLFTDLANPTSNRIYGRMGYEPVCDVDEVRFL